MTLVAAPGNDVIWPNIPGYTKSRIDIQKESGWTPLGDRPRLRYPSTPSERNINCQRHELMGTNSGNAAIRIGDMVIIVSSTVHQDTFLDDEVGDTIRHIKENFGDAPLLEAYKAALDTFKEPERKWKEYLDEEEAKFKSIFG